MDIPIIFEDADLLIVNKPSGVVVNIATSVKGETVQDWASAYLQIPQPDPLPVQAERQRMKETQSYESSDKTIEFAARAGIVHRIDKETSGLLLIAKNPKIFGALQEQFKSHNVKKTYVALVHGSIVPEEGEVIAPIDRLPWNRERFGIVPGGKESMTRYRVIGSSFTVNGEHISLVELYPETGRTHQIRVHMKYINHPLLGDYLYAGRKTSRGDREWATRVMLHAWKISFQHPINQKMLAFVAPIPDDMRRIIQFSNNPILE